MQLVLREYDTPTMENNEVVNKEKKEGAMEERESEMKGVPLRADISLDKICIIIPRKYLITFEIGQATSFGKTVLESDLDVDALRHIYFMTRC